MIYIRKLRKGEIMAFYLHGVNLPHRKNTDPKTALKLNFQGEVVLPMSMHIGAPAVPIVKKGEQVFVGTPIAKKEGYICAPIHSSVSGTVSKIADYILHDGRKVQSVVIKSDGDMTVDASITPPTVNTREDFVSALSESGIVGLGGAGFPTYVKFNVEPEKVSSLIINGAECEPYITSDSYTMINRSDDISYAIAIIAKLYNLNEIIIGIESNKKEAISAMQALASRDSRIKVKLLPIKYPQGAEKVLVYHTTGKVIPEGKLPLDVGCVVCNCTTIASIGAFLKTGMPLVEKCVSVCGGAVSKPMNVICPIGTPISALFELCDGFCVEPEKLISGGPMMGIALPSADAPVLKNTNAVLALSHQEVVLPKTSNCIRCGSCAAVCPFGINPSRIELCYKQNRTDEFLRLGANLCMECGCCSFICPANRPLVQTNKLAKAMIKEIKAKEDAK